MLLAAKIKIDAYTLHHLKQLFGYKNLPVQLLKEKETVNVASLTALKPGVLGLLSSASCFSSGIWRLGHLLTLQAH